MDRFITEKMVKRCCLTQLAAGNENILHIDNFRAKEDIDLSDGF
jgi:hypothetical protein